MSRADDLDRLYELLGLLAQSLGGYRYLQSCHGGMDWPERGVYFFFEEGERRADGCTLRVVRVGTHTLTAGSHSTLWQRLSHHRGNKGGRYAAAGNHRGSVFRLHVGKALLNTTDYGEAVRRSWGRGSVPDHTTRVAEYALETAVSAFIQRMPFLWAAVPDPPGPSSHRAVIEANAVALLSNYRRRPLDPPSENWLGRRAEASGIRGSGLWNVRHVRDEYDPLFLKVLEGHVRGS